MSKEDEALKLALEYLKLQKTYGPAMAYGNTTIDEAIDAIKKVLVADFVSDFVEQPAPVQQCMDHGECFGGKCIYPAPQPAQSKPLTDEEIIEHFEANVNTGSLLSFVDGVRYAESVHGIKENT